MTDKPRAPNIVPFGKYKGQPVEALAQDRPYLEWLSAQDWFRERYTGIYTLIVNNFTEASETPDHNALQVLFLDDDFCARFLTVLKPQWRAEGIKKLTENVLEQKRQLAGELGQRVLRASDEAYKKQIDEALAKFSNVTWALRCGREFEQRGIDVRLVCRIETVEGLPGRFSGHDSIFLSYSADTTVGVFNIEIKPAVGDDYPAVLRQMRASRSSVLFTESYTGIGATEAQFVKTFALSDIKVVFRRDVDAVELADATGGQLTLNADQKSGGAS
jgi:hypothetical protein